MKSVLWLVFLSLTGSWAVQAALSSSTPSTPVFAAVAGASSKPLASQKAPWGSRVVDWNSLTVRPTANGERRDVLDAPTATLLTLESHITTILPGKWAHPPHRHPHEELILLKEGTLEVTLNDTITRIGPGSFFVVAPNDLHGVRNVGETNATYHVFTWKTPATPAALQAPAK